MIFDDPTRTAIGNLGWVDHGSIWRFDLESCAESRIPVEGADYLTLKAGVGDLFRLTHHGSKNVGASVRRKGNPEVELATLVLHGDGAHLEGERGLWADVERSVLIQSNDGPRLFWINADAGVTTALDLSWYNGSNYDLGYQGLTDSLALPDLKRVIVSVQRSSELVIIDVEANRKTGTIQLADRGGNPDLLLIAGSNFLATDYDTLCLVNPDGLFRKVTRKRRLQDSAGTGTMQFIGDYHVVGSDCAVARPYSNDVVLLDLNSFEISAHARFDCQPIDVCLISGSELVVRDWQTGTIELGTFSTS